MDHEDNNEVRTVNICATLQALRWRLTRVKPWVRRQVLTSYAHFDIIDCKSQPPTDSS